MRGLGSNLADQLANAQPPLPLTTLGFLVGAPLVLHGARPGLPDLQHLVLEHPPWTSCVTTFFELLGAPIATGLRSLALQTANLRYVLTADPRGRLTHLVIDAASATDRTLGGVALEDLAAHGVQFDPMQVSYFLGREVLVRALVPKMALWRLWMFLVMARNAVPATVFFRIPSDRVVELGVRVAI